MVIINVNLALQHLKMIVYGHAFGPTRSIAIGKFLKFIFEKVKKILCIMIVTPTYGCSCIAKKCQC